MREKIVELAKEVWEYEQISLEIPAQELQLEVEAESSICGVFHIKNTEKKIMRGRAYISGNTLLRLTKAEFFGTEGLISYEFCAKGLLCGEAQKGVIEVYADCGYLSVECKIQVILPYVDSSIGRIDNLMRFTELCQKEWKEALQIFRSADFERVFLSNNERLKETYQGLLRGENSANSLEEFLIAARRKQPLKLFAQKNHISFSNVKEEREEFLILKRNTWGYGKYTISSNSAFLQPDKNILWADSFVKDEYSLRVFLQPKYLHKGRNIGVITLKSVTDYVEITIEVIEELSETEKAYVRRCKRKKELKLQLLKGLRGLSIGFLKGNSYVNRQQTIIQEYQAVFPDDFRELCRLHFEEVLGNRERALEMLRKLQLSKQPAMVFGEHCREAMEKGELFREQASVYGSYLYLGVLLYARETLGECRVYLSYLEQLAKKYPEWDELLLLYIMAAMCTMPQQTGFGKGKVSDELATYLLLLCGRSEKKQKKCDSSFLYIQACHIWNYRPDILTRLDTFSIPALYAGIKYKMLSKSLKSQFIYLAGSTNYYHPLIFNSLCRLYKESAEDEVLSAILRHLIRGQQAGKRYLPYFRLGIEKRFRITQLYEYFIYSMPEDDMEPFPPQVLTYFQYACTLPERKKAALYANIVNNRGNDPKTYLNYQSQMERFALEQVMAHKISRNLSILYADLLNSTNMDAASEGHLAQIMFRQEVICHEPEIKGLYILYEKMEKEEYIPFVNGKALVNLLTEKDVLLFEDKEGGRHYSINYTINRLFRLDELFEKCMELGPENDLLILSLLKKAEKSKNLGRAELSAMEKALSMKGLSESSRGKIWLALLEYYYENFDEERLRELLALNISVDVPAQKRLIELSISANEMKKAYDLLNEGYCWGSLESLSAKKLSSLVHWKFENKIKEENYFLAKACYILFRKGIARKEQISFLLQNMEGTVKEMLLLWHSTQAQEEELKKEHCLLGESILIHVLFSKQELFKFHSIFIRYYEERECFKYTEHYHLTDVIVRAYLFVYASSYLHDKEREEETIFEIIFKELSHTRMQACKYALLKYFSKRKKPYTEEQLSWIEANAKECIEESMIFPFFRDFGEEVRIPSGVRNSCYVSYMAAPSHTITLHYCYQNEKGQGIYESQVMKNRFQGIYVQSFLLFYDEKLTYYITEEQDGIEIAKTPEMEINEEKEFTGKENSFTLINTILAAKDMKDDVTMRQSMEHYIEIAYAQKQLFMPFFKKKLI